WFTTCRTTPPITMPMSSRYGCRANAVKYGAMPGGSGLPPSRSMTIASGHGWSAPSAISDTSSTASSATRPRYGRSDDSVHPISPSVARALIRPPCAAAAAVVVHVGDIDRDQVAVPRLERDVARHVQVGARRRAAVADVLSVARRSVARHRVDDPGLRVDHPDPVVERVGDVDVAVGRG